MSVLGEGGIGKVVQSYLLQDGMFVSAVMKACHQYPIGINDPYEAQKSDYNRRAKAMFAIEMFNAVHFLKEPIPGLIEPVLVAPAANDKEQSVIAYRAINNAKGETRNFSSLAQDYRIPASQTFTAFAHAVQVLANLHERGLVHLDFKPDNVMINEENKGQVIDIGSLFSKHDRIVLDTEGDPKPHGGVYKQFKYGDEIVTRRLGHSPHYVDLAKVKKALELGR